MFYEDTLRWDQAERQMFFYQWMVKFNREFQATRGSERPSTVHLRFRKVQLEKLFYIMGLLEVFIMRENYSV